MREEHRRRCRTCAPLKHLHTCENDAHGQRPRRVGRGVRSDPHTGYDWLIHRALARISRRLRQRRHLADLALRRSIAFDGSASCRHGQQTPAGDNRARQVAECGNARVQRPIASAAASAKLNSLAGKRWSGSSGCGFGIGQLVVCWIERLAASRRWRPATQMRPRSEAWPRRHGFRLAAQLIEGEMMSGQAMPADKFACSIAAIFHPGHKTEFATVRTLPSRPRMASQYFLLRHRERIKPTWCEGN